MVLTLRTFNNCYAKWPNPSNKKTQFKTGIKKLEKLFI